MKIYTEKEVLKSCLEWFKGDRLSADVWMGKYALKNKKGQFVELSPLDRFESMADEINRIDSNYVGGYHRGVYLDALVEQRLIIGGSGNYGIANPFSITSLSNCFVISGNNQDSYGSIMKNDQEIVQIAKRRGGVGIDVSHLRPYGMYVTNSAGSTSGLVSFCKRFSNTTREVGQENRRGALMLSVSVAHPDSPSFVRMKTDKNQVTGANVSVRVSNEFMKCVEEDKYFQIRFPIDLPYMEIGKDETWISEDGTQMRKMIRARDLWDEMIKANWDSAEPGILFWDTIKSESPADCYPNYQTESTNPCGEIPLCPYDSCRLLSQNLTKYVKNPFTKGAYFDFEAFDRDVHLSVHVMDNIIDLEIEKIDAIIAKVHADPEDEFTKSVEVRMWEQIRKKAVEGRRTGISIVGHGDTLAMLGIRYGSPFSVAWVEAIHRRQAEKSYEYSAELAKNRGAFADFDPELERKNPFLMRIGKAGIPRRNIALLTIPPLGTGSLIAGNITSGIEPVFMPAYKRRRKLQAGHNQVPDFVDETGDEWEEYNVLHPNFKKWANINYPELKVEKLTENALNELVSLSPYAGASAPELDPEDKIRLIAAAQKYVDHSISNTTNLPKDVSLESVSNLYLLGWKLGCKGVTIYRDGSRDGVLNSNEIKTSKFEYKDAPKRPKDLPCDIFQPTIHGDKFIVLVGLFDEKPYEVIAIKKNDLQLPSRVDSGILRKRRSGVYDLQDVDGYLLIDDITSKFEVPEWEFITRLISTALRHGASIDFIVEQLNKSAGTIVDISKVIARQLKKYIEVELKSTTCPSCSAEMTPEGGCLTCKECGYAACG